VRKVCTKRYNKQALGRAPKGIRHTYIKPSSPQLNGKVERSHQSDEQEFYPLLSYIGDVDLGGTCWMGAALQARPTTQRPQRKDALRGVQGKVIISPVRVSLDRSG